MKFIRIGFLIAGLYFSTCIVASAEMEKLATKDRTEVELRDLARAFSPCLSRRDNGCLEKLLVDNLFLESGFGCSSKTGRLKKASALACILDSETRYGGSVKRQTLFEVLKDCYEVGTEVSGTSFKTKHAFQCQHKKVDGKWKLDSIYLTD